MPFEPLAWQPDECLPSAGGIFILTLDDPARTRRWRWVRSMSGRPRSSSSSPAS